MSNKGKGINIWSLKRSIPRGVLRKGILKICSKFTGDTKTANENILFLKFSIKGSSVNVTKSAGNGGFGHIYWRNPWKTSFFVQ